MACLVVAGWTWVLAAVSLGDNPVWAVIMSAFGGVALGLLLVMTALESERLRVQPPSPTVRPRRLGSVRAAPRPTRSAATSKAHESQAAGVPPLLLIRRE